MYLQQECVGCVSVHPKEAYHSYNNVNMGNQIRSCGPCISKYQHQNNGLVNSETASVTRTPGPRGESIDWFCPPSAIPQASFSHVSNSFTQTTGISDVPSNPSSCLHCIQHVAVMGFSLIAAYPCASPSLIRGLLVCPSESICFTVSK